MLERARVRNVFASLNLADVSDTRLPGSTYDLVMMCLVDEHLAELAPLYTEAARIPRDGAAFVIIGFHPFFIMAAGMPTHFKDSSGDPVAGETHVHLFSDHAKAAFAAGWQLAEFRGSEIADPKGLLEGNGKFMRHVKLSPERDVDAAALMKLIETAYTDIKGRLKPE